MSFPPSSINNNVVRRKLLNLFPKDENDSDVCHYRITQETSEYIAFNLDKILEKVLLSAAENASKERRVTIRPEDVDFSCCWEVDMRKVSQLSGCFKLSLY